MLKTYATSPLTYKFDDTSEDHVISVQNNASYDFSHPTQIHDGLIELSIPFYTDYVPLQIPEKTFKNCADLSSVEGLQIRTVGKETFNFCDSLKIVRLPNTVKIDAGAFANCNLSILTLSDAYKITEINTDTFANNFRRPISVYIPSILSNDWYDSTKNNNWKYIISSLLSSISAEFENKDYIAIILSANNTQYNNEVQTLMRNTSNQGNNCKEIWDRLYPNILLNFINLVTTISTLRYTYPDDSTEQQYFTRNQKTMLTYALNKSSNDSDLLSDIIDNCNIGTLNLYSLMSSNANYKYMNNLQKISQFPVYDTSALNIFERYRPLSANIGILSAKVDINSAIANIYRTSRNTVEELDDIFAPLSTFGHYLSSSKEISATQYMNKDLSTVNNAIEWFLSCLNKFKEIIR